jgi:hypothetical protein
VSVCDVRAANLYCTVSVCDVRAATFTEVFPCFFLSCKANIRVKLAKYIQYIEGRLTGLVTSGVGTAC